MQSNTESASTTPASSRYAAALHAAHLFEQLELAAACAARDLGRQAVLLRERATCADLSAALAWGEAGVRSPDQDAAEDAAFARVVDALRSSLFEFAETSPAVAQLAETLRSVNER